MTARGHDSRPGSATESVPPDAGANGATWTVLGAGSILPRAGHGPAAYALRPAAEAPVTLFDCGPGTVRALASVGIRLCEVERVVVSHFHPDHTLDLFALFFARRNPHLADELRTLELIGPAGLERLVAAGQQVYGRWVADPRCVVREVSPRATGAPPERLQVGGGAAAFELSCAPAHHTREALAWRADLAHGASVTFSGDSGWSDAVAALARGCSLFCCECSFPDDEAVEGHLTPSSAGRLAALAGCRALLLTHFYPSLDPREARRGAARAYAGPIHLARDGAVFALPPG